LAPRAQAHIAALENEYAVSPKSPLLSTTVQKNAWVCGAWRGGRAAAGAAGGAVRLRAGGGRACGAWRCGRTQAGAAAAADAAPPRPAPPFRAGDNTRGQLGVVGKSVLVPQAIQVGRVRGGGGGERRCGGGRRRGARRPAPAAGGGGPAGARQRRPQRSLHRPAPRPRRARRQAGGRWAAIALSDSHAAGLTSQGTVFTWGSNTRGQLGHGEKCPAAVDAPVRVAALADMDIK
jgi:hypothetical protein